MEVRPALSAGDPIIFLQWQAAARWSRVEPYRLICEVFQCGLIDRTKTLDLGFAAHIVDPLGPILSGPMCGLSFAEICDARAGEIVNESIVADCGIQVLWSGGIDSTVALIALMNAASQRNVEHRLQVLCSVESVTEYPRFFHQHIWRQWETVAVGCPISQYLCADAIVVTGEHGDQLFGSDFLRPYVENGLAFLPWQEVLPFALSGNGLSPGQGFAVTEYLRPLMAACPTPIVTLFDFFWWLNFSCKWQSVTLRIPANAENPRSSFDSMRHFFRTDDFQNWSVFRHQRESLPSWREYKMPAKRYIYDCQGDEQYFTEKEKERSLRLVIAGEPRRDQPPVREPPPPRRRPPLPTDPPDPASHESVVNEFASHHLVLAADFAPLWIKSA